MFEGMRVVSLHIYPVKGVRAINLDRSHLGQRGLEGDRRWLVVDAQGKFITQRTHPRLALIRAVPTGAGLRLNAAGHGDLVIDKPSKDNRIDVTIWVDRASAAVADTRAHAWLCAVIGDDLRLVYMDAFAERLRVSVWTEAPVLTSFADSFPVLITTTGSLAAINRAIEGRGGVHVPMTRFRPNIVVDCGEAWREDSWRLLRIGGAELELVKPCERCVVTTKDQQSGETTGEEPLATLARLRVSGDPRAKGFLFGWNAAPRVLGEIKVGDHVEVLNERPEGFPIRPVHEPADAFAF